jgi:hypothetical protein
MGKAPHQLTINSRSYTASCGGCAALMLPNATVCRRCGGLAVDYDRRIDYDRPVVLDQPAVPAAVPVPLDDAFPAWARPNPERLSTILSCWPFGPADASDGPAITTFTEPAPSAPRLEPVTYPSDVPMQRVESFPARILQGQEGAQAG